jgi:hypothetical protein
LRAIAAGHSRFLAIVEFVATTAATAAAAALAIVLVEIHDLCRAVADKACEYAHWGPAFAQPA